jgi:hypothetical protein
MTGQYEPYCEACLVDKKVKRVVPPPSFATLYIPSAVAQMVLFSGLFVQVTHFM